jgi:ectoine hydroxylase-related dioxygenase (phytanoyl-CoA dioxygenase family)
MTNINLRKGTFSENQILDEEGFVHLEDVLPSKLLYDFCHRLSKIFEQIKQTNFASSQQKFWQRDPSEHIETLRLPSVEKFLENDRVFLAIEELVTNLVRDKFNSHLDLHGVHAFLKPAKNGGETPWHQDPAYGDNLIIHNNITCWIPLRDIFSELESCLEFLPGSHLGKELRHHNPLSKDHLSALVADISNDEIARRVTVPCKLGDIIVHRSYIIHRGTANRSNIDRIAVVFIYGKNS